MAHFNVSTLHMRFVLIEEGELVHGVHGEVARSYAHLGEGEGDHQTVAVRPVDGDGAIDGEVEGHAGISEEAEYDQGRIAGRH